MFSFSILTCQTKTISRNFTCKRTHTHTNCLLHLQHVFSRCGWVGPQFVLEETEMALRQFMDPQQAGNGCFGSSDRILQRRRGQSREPAQSSAASQVPRPPSEPAVCTAFTVVRSFKTRPLQSFMSTSSSSSWSAQFNRLWRE